MRIIMISLEICDTSNMCLSHTYFSDIFLFVRWIHTLCI